MRGIKISMVSLHHFLFDVAMTMTLLTCAFELGQARPPSDLERGFAALSDIEASPTRSKRLMGIFRCKGWAPGCVDNLHQSKLHEGVGPYRLSPPLVPSHVPAPRGRYSGSSGGPRWGANALHSFEPFFTLTSGGSWGPMGRRKRVSAVGQPQVDIHKIVQRLLRNLLLNQLRSRRSVH